jgi:hypothetical protein
MVAEYGDEIFAYMRELEVSLRIILASSLPLIVDVGPLRVPAPRPCGDLLQPLMRPLFMSRHVMFTSLRHPTDQSNRTRCCLMPTTWISKPRFSGRCVRS